MTIRPITWLVIVAIGLTFWYFVFQGLRWAARTMGGWGVLWLSAGLLALFAGIAAAAWVRDRRDEREPWCDVPWEVRR